MTFTPPLPDVTLNQGTNAITVNSKSYTVSGTATDINNSHSQLELYVNGIEKYIYSDGTFIESLTLVEGLNTITIKAVNTYGKETILTKKVTYIK